VLVQVLSNAKRTILVQAYNFTSAPIAKALLDAHKRGVRVQVILDKSQPTEKYSSADFLANQGVPTLIDAEHAIAHNKIMIIDGETVLTGSFNFTKAAQEKNAENLLIIRDPALAAQYIQNWEAGQTHLNASHRQSVVVVPTSAVSLHRHPVTACLFLLEQGQCEMPEQREVFGSVPLAKTAVVLAKGAIEPPVACVFTGPVAPHTLGHPLGVQTKAADVVASFI
jgi:phosphatidylserine/phosphatidylglycerophosphate/cardiolipin synthase-like enzyme